MTRKTKQELIAQVVALLDALIEVEDNAPTIMVSAKEQPVEMLTIKECTERSEDCPNILSVSSLYRTSCPISALVRVSVERYCQQGGAAGISGRCGVMDSMDEWLTLIISIHKPVTMCDGCDDIYDSGCGAENIVTSSHIVAKCRGYPSASPAVCDRKKGTKRNCLPTDYFPAK